MENGHPMALDRIKNFLRLISSMTETDIPDSTIKFMTMDQRCERWGEQDQRCLVQRLAGHDASSQESR